MMEPEVDVDVENSLDYDLDESGQTLDIEEFLAMGINPSKSTKAKPGTEEKVLMLSARYAAGLPLWNERDCYDHGPKESDLMGAVNDSLHQPLPLPESDEEEDL